MCVWVCRHCKYVRMYSTQTHIRMYIRIIIILMYIASAYKCLCVHRWECVMLVSRDRTSLVDTTTYVFL